MVPLSTSGWPAGKGNAHPADLPHSLCFYLEHYHAGSFTKIAHPAEIPTDQRADAPVPSCPALGGNLCPVGTCQTPPKGLPLILPFLLSQGHLGEALTYGHLCQGHPGLL